jgi:hypothetical protein
MSPSPSPFRRKQGTVQAQRDALDRLVSVQPAISGDSCNQTIVRNARTARPLRETESSAARLVVTLRAHEGGDKISDQKRAEQKTIEDARSRKLLPLSLGEIKARLCFEVGKICRIW